MEVQEALEEAKDGGLDEAARAAAARGARAAPRRAARRRKRPSWTAWRRVGRAPSSRAPTAAPLLAWFKDALATRAYLRTVIDDLSEALGEDQDAHVSHRRH